MAHFVFEFTDDEVVSRYVLYQEIPTVANVGEEYNT